MRECKECGRRFAAGESVCPDDGTVLTDTASFEEQAVGKTLDGKYRVDGFLKRGGMGAVYRGTHLMLNKPVAIKLIKPELVSSNDVVQRFLREARAAAHLSHPNIVTVHDLGQTADGMLYIAMELVDGSSLKEIIVSEGAWEPERALRLIKGVASALALAHRKGVVHRDLKPQNIMVSHDSDGNEFPKLLDFGIAKTFEPTSPALTSTGMVLGTPHYMSAEQAKGQPADRRSDLYALGVILYEMLVGKVPFDDTSIPQILIKHLSEPPKPPSAMGANIPKELEALVLRCLEKDPERRYQTAEELMVALDGIPDTAAMEVPAPTIAATEVDPSTRPARETTMAGAAAAAVPPPPPPTTATVRAHEVPVRKGGGSRLVWVGLAAVLLAVVALFLLRGRNAPPAAAETAAAVSQPASEDTPAAEPSSSPEPEAAAPAPATPPSSASVAEPTPEVSSEPEPEPVESSAKPMAPEPEPPAPVTQAPEPPVPAQAAPSPTPPPSPPPLPETPAIGVACDGVRDGCAALRFALVEECRKRGVPMARPRRADVRLRIDVEEVEARSEQQFGTTFVVRTYAIEAGGGSPHFEEELVLPPKMVTFDARLGREKLREQSRVIASELVDRIADYWTRNTR